MKKYVKPSFKMVKLCAEEGIACGGSSEVNTDHAYTGLKFEASFNLGWLFGDLEDFLSKIFAHKKHSNK